MSNSNQTGSALGSKESPFAFVYANTSVGNFEGSVLFRAVNNTGSTIEAHKIVAISDVIDEIPQISLTNNSLNSLPALGITEESVIDGGEVNVISLGNIVGIDTSLLAVGDVLYTSSSLGDFTSTKPEGSDTKVQPIGIVISSDTEGVIRVIPSFDLHKERSEFTYSLTSTSTQAQLNHYYSCGHNNESLTLTLPPSISNNGLIKVKNMGTGTVTIARSSIDTIDNASSDIVISTQYESFTFISNGANGWERI